MGRSLFVEYLPVHYKVYVLYYPGAGYLPILENKLRGLGQTIGNNIFVNIGRNDDPNYEKVSKRFHIDKLPAIVVTGNEGVASLKRDGNNLVETVYVKLDGHLLEDTHKCIKAIEALYQAFISCRISAYLKDNRKSKPVMSSIKNLLNFISEKELTVSLFEGQLEIRPAK